MSTHVNTPFVPAHLIEVICASETPTGGPAAALQVGTSPTTNASFTTPVTGSIQLESDTKKIAVKQLDGSFLYYVPEPTVVYDLGDKTDYSVSYDYTTDPSGDPIDITEVLPGWSPAIEATLVAAMSAGKTIRYYVDFGDFHSHSSAVQGQIYSSLGMSPDSTTFLQFTYTSAGTPSSANMYAESWAYFDIKYEDGAFITTNYSGGIADISLGGGSGGAPKQISNYVSGGTYPNTFDGKIYLKWYDFSSITVGAWYFFRLKISILN